MRKVRWEKWKDQHLENYNEQEIFIKTPYGLLPQRMNPSSGEINFWLGHTNFDIGKDEILIINNTIGVDIFTYFTPYCFRISIGKLFNNNKVLKNVATNLGCVFKKNLTLSSQQTNEIKKIKIDLVKNKYWLIYVLPNGNFESYSFDNEYDFISCYSYFKNLKNSIGGQVLSTLSDKIGV